MRKKLAVLLIFIFVLNSCKENKTEKSAVITVKDTVEPSVSKKSRLTEAEIKEQKKEINHLFIANGGSILYMKNGDVKGAARFDTDGDFVGELLQMETYGKYTDHDNYVLDKERDTTHFFGDYGKIAYEWVILKGIAVDSKMQVMSFSTPKSKVSDDTEIISDTRLIIFKPKEKTFENDESPEAEAYYTAMDDWNYYSHELNDYFEKLKVETFYMKKRYLTIEIEDGKKITIDTREPINNFNAHCLLYKKNKRPILVYLLTGDNEESDIENYLKSK